MGVQLLAVALYVAVGYFNYNGYVGFVFAVFGCLRLVDDYSCGNYNGSDVCRQTYLFCLLLARSSVRRYAYPSSVQARRFANRKKLLESILENFNYYLHNACNKHRRHNVYRQRLGANRRCNGS